MIPVFGVLLILAQGNRWKCTAKGKHDWRSYAILLATFGSIHLGTFSRLVATQPTSQLCSQTQHDGASSTLAKATCCVACGRSAATLVGLTATHRHETAASVLLGVAPVSSAGTPGAHSAR